MHTSLLDCFENVAETRNPSYRITVNIYAEVTPKAKNEIAEWFSKMLES